MRIDYLSSWAPRPGRLLQVRPTAAALAAAAAAPVSPGLPSFLQQDHLDAFRGTRARGGTHRAWTGTASHQSGPLQEDALAGTLRRFIARHEGLRTWFDLSGPETVRRIVPAEAIELEVVEIDGPADWASGWEEWVVARCDEACRPDSWPPFALLVVAREHDWSWAYACDHAFTDGASQILAALEIAAAYAEETGTPGPELPPAGSFVAYAAAERERAAGYGPDAPEVTAWMDIMRRHDGRLPRFPLDLGLEPGETAPVVLREYDVLDGEQVAALDAVVRAAGGRFVSGVFAALAATERRLTGRDRYLGAAVMGTRDGDHLLGQGWYCNFAPVDVPVADEPFAVTVAAAEAAYRVAKELTAMPVHVALGALLMAGLTTPEQLGSPQLVSYLDLRKFPGGGVEAFDRGLVFTGVGRTGNASLWVNREEGRLQVGAQTPDTPQAQDAIDTYVATLREVLLTAIASAAEAVTGAAQHG